MDKLLVIDDEYLVRLGIRRTIPWDEHGIAVVGEAANGRDGLKLALELAPDVIICDVRMPVMDGIEFVRQVGEHGLDCAVVILSGYQEFEYVKGTLEGGAFAYLLKPVDNDELVETVKRALKELKARRSAARRVQALEEALPSAAQGLLLALLSGDTDSGEPLLGLLEGRRFPVHRPGHVVYGQIDPDTAAGEEQMRHALRTLFEKMSHVLEREGVPHLGCHLESSLAFLVGDEDGERIKRLCEEAIDQCEGDGLEATVTLGVSLPWDGIAGVPEAWRQAREAAKGKLFPALHAVVVYGGEHGRYKPHVLAAMRYIAEHYGEEVTVREVAARLFVSESYLMHLFRENVGQTFNECLTMYRMLMAKRMLREGKYRIYEIAERVGYSDPKYFSQVFRKYVGVPPSQYGDGRV